MAKKELNIRLGERIRKNREQLGWTREYLAEVAGCSTRFIAMIEVGSAGVSLDNLLIFSRKLGVSVDYLLNGYTDNTHFKDFTDKLTELQRLNPKHIENIEVIVDAYIRGVKQK